jgi:hypothetical protein
MLRCALLYTNTPEIIIHIFKQKTRALAVDSNRLLYELQVGTDVDPKKLFKRACEVSKKDRFVLRIDPNKCNHITEKNYKVVFETGSKFLKNFRKEMDLPESSPKVCGHQFVKIFPIGGLINRFKYPTDLPAIVTDVSSADCYDANVPSDPTTWYDPNDLMPPSVDIVEDEDDNFDEYFRSFQIPDDSTPKKRPANAGDFDHDSQSATTDHAKKSRKLNK